MEVWSWRINYWCNSRGDWTCLKRAKQTTGLWMPLVNILFCKFQGAYWTPAVEPYGMLCHHQLGIQLITKMWIWGIWLNLTIKHGHFFNFFNGFTRYSWRCWCFFLSIFSPSNIWSIHSNPDFWDFPNDESDVFPCFHGRIDSWPQLDLWWSVGDRPRFFFFSIAKWFTLW